MNSRRSAVNSRRSAVNFRRSGGEFPQIGAGFVPQNCREFPQIGAGFVPQIRREFPQIRRRGFPSADLERKSQQNRRQIPRACPRCSTKALYIPQARGIPSAFARLIANTAEGARGIPSAFARLIANTAEGGGGGVCVRRWRTYRTHTQHPIPIPRVRGSRAKRHCVTVGVGKRHEDESGVLCIDTSTKTQKQSSECTTEQRHERHARVEVALRCRGDGTYEAGTPPHS